MKNKGSLILIVLVLLVVFYYMLSKTKDKNKPITAQSDIGGIVYGILSSPALGAFAGAALANSQSTD